MLVPEEEHDCHGIVELVHLLEVGDLVEIADVDDGEVFDFIGDTVEDLVLAHAVGVYGHVSICTVRENERGREWEGLPQSRPKRMTTRRSSSDMMAWSTCQPVTKWGRTTEPMLAGGDVSGAERVGFSEGFGNGSWRDSVREAAVVS